MRIFPEMWANTMCPFSSLTLKLALGSVSTTSPCISIRSSFAINSWIPSSWRRSARRETALEVGFLQQAFVLVRHDVSLHLGHEIHRHHDDDQQRSTAEVKWDVKARLQELGHQAH